MADTIAACEAEAPKSLVDAINEEVSDLMLLAHTMNNRIKESESVLRMKLDIMDGLLDRMITVIRTYPDVSDFILGDFRVEMAIMKEELNS